MPEPTTSPSQSPTYFPTYLASYWPTYSPIEMEKGKSQKSPKEEKEDKKNDDKKKEDKVKGKGDDDVTESKPARPPNSPGRPSGTSITRPVTSISRPSPFDNPSDSMPSESPSESLPLVQTLPPSAEIFPSSQPGTPPSLQPIASPSHAPFSSAEETTSTSPSSRPSNEPSSSVDAIPSSNPSESPTEPVTMLTQKPSQAPSMGATLSDETIEEQNEPTSANDGSSIKVSISGDMSKNQHDTSNVSISNSGKVSFSGVTGEEKSEETTKISMAGVLSTKKYDNADISINSKGKVSFRGADDDDYTPEPTSGITPEPVANNRRESSKISMTGILSSRNKSPSVSIKGNGKVSFSRRNDDDDDTGVDSTPSPTYWPSYIPTAGTPSKNQTPPSDRGNSKISLSFPLPSSTVGNTDPAPSPSNTNGFKPFSSYTEMPTAGSETLTPTLAPEKVKVKDKKDKIKKTPSPTNQNTDEPTYFVYPTYFPSYVPTPIVTGQYRNYLTPPSPPSETLTPESSPTYWPSYVPTQEAKALPARPSFGFGDANGRETNFGLIEFNTPQDDDALNETFSVDETTVMDFMASKNEDVTSDQNTEEESVEANQSDDLDDIYEKRICPGFPLGVDPSAQKVEQEVFFTYGIETDNSDGSSIGESVEELQRKILDDTALVMLRCNERRLWRDRYQKSVSRVYYKRNASISTLSKCTPRGAKSKHCAIVKSTVYLTVTEGQENAARVDALSVINHSLDNGGYESGSVQNINYLGPDVQQLSTYLESKSLNNGSTLTSEASATPYLFYAACVTVSIACIALVAYGMIMFRNRRKVKRAKQYERYANNSTIQSRTNDPCLSRQASELSDWRSLVGRQRF